MTKKNHAWKACNRHKRFPSSNLGHSASKASSDGISRLFEQMGEKSQNAAQCGKTFVKCSQMRKVTVSLYYRQPTRKDGTANLLLAVHHAGSGCYIPISGMRLRPDQWDARRRKVVNHPRHATLNSVAASLLGAAENAVAEIMRHGGVRGLTTAQVRDRVAAILFPEGERDTGLVDVMRAYMERCKREKTAEKFEGTISHIERWRGSRARRVRFADVTPAWLEDFDSYLVTTCPSPNSRAIHLRNVRTVFNYALENELTDAPYPFRKFKIRTAPSVHVTLTLEQTRQLWRHLPADPLRAYWLDMWRLTFALIGINTVDLAALERVTQGRVNYTRRKTGRVYSVKVEPVAAALIAAHRGRKHLVDLLERYKSVHVVTGRGNRVLKEIAEDLGLPPLTFYTARYTWATIALSQGVAIEVISQALGHTYGMAVTLGYITPDRRKVDEANARVLACVCT